jgi:sugar phosphate isomerase/epimerase
MLWGYAGIFPGGFGVWQGDVPMNMLNFAADNGFRSAHIGLRELKDPARRDQIGQFVADRDMQLVLGAGLRCFDPDQDAVRRAADDLIERIRAYADVVRAPICTTGAGPVHRFMDSPSLEEQLDALSFGLGPVAEACHEMGRPLGIENHGDYYCQDLVELCERTPHLGIFLDTGNTYLIGEQSLPACRLAAPYTIGTHFKDHKVHPDLKELKFVIEGSVLGDGHVGLREVYGYLKELAPNPDALVMHWEMVPPKDMDAWECLEKSWQFVRSLEEG